MGKNMNYIGPRYNSPSYNVERKGKDPGIALEYFLKSPTGILLQGLFAKAYNTTPEKAIRRADLMGDHDEMDMANEIDKFKNLTSLEKRKLEEAIHRFNIYKYRGLLKSAQYQRGRDKERSEYTVDEYSHKGFKYAMPLEEEENGLHFGTPPLDTLDLERKKKSAKAKAKRKSSKKVTKKVVKKCKCR
jgi:hypothetical protein